MTALVLYVANRYLTPEKARLVTDAAQSAVCDGLHLDPAEVAVVLENFEDWNSNERVNHCFFPVLYMPEGSPYAYRKKAGELMCERLCALFPEEEIGHCYFHMKEHPAENVAVNGKLLKYDIGAQEHLDRTRGTDTMPWMHMERGGSRE